MWNVMPITGAFAAAMLTAAPVALAQVRSPGTPSPSSDTATIALVDSAYIRQAMRGNFLEIALGRLAESRADNSEVKEFGERMITDHNSMNQQWTTLAQKNGMRIDLTLDPAAKQSVERLEDLKGAEFDQAYMTDMIRQHEQALASFQRMAVSARTPEVRQMASSGVPIIRDHLTLAQQVGSRVGIATTAARTGVDTFSKPRPRTGADTFSTPTPSNNDRARTTPTDRATRDERDDGKDRNERGALRGEDRAFVQEVLMDHYMHVRLADRAQREAKRDEVRQFAERMEKEFTDWGQRWTNLAQRYDVKAPTHLGRLHGEKVEKLERASKGNYDRTYVKIVADHLESLVPYLQKEGQAVRPIAVRRLAEDELPVIRELLARARRLENQASERADASKRD